MDKIINWAILGPGRIAEKFADAFRDTPQARLYAVGSREAKKANEFASKHSIPKVHTSYEALAADPDVDIVYVATPHSFHHEQTLLCLRHKKAVLCEKPLTLSLKSAQELVHAAKENDVFLMEGMWSRFFPSIIKVRDLILEGAIGDVKFVRGDFGFTYPYDAMSRVYNPDLAGGAQLDVGVYPMFLALFLLGRPQKIQALARLAPTGVDETTSAQFSFANGEIAHIFSSFVTETSKQAEITGTLGSITIQAPWYKSQAIVVKKNNGDSKQFDYPFTGFGFVYQLRHVTECMQRGLKESPMMTFDFTLMMAEVADEILKQCGVLYPDRRLS